MEEMEMMKMNARHGYLFVLPLLAGCLLDPPTAAKFIPNDSGAMDTGVRQDAEPGDADQEDAVVRRDAEPRDADVLADARPSDSGINADAAPRDAGIHPDAMIADSGVHPDAEPEDAGPAPDAGFFDSGGQDTGLVPDGGAPDTGADAGFPDAGPRDSGTLPGYVLIPAGSFMMGSPPGEPGRFADEGPRHLVTITRPFFMKQTEIRRSEWRPVMGPLHSPQAPCAVSPDDDCPVTALDRDLLIVYANALSSREGLPQCYMGMPFNWTFAGFDCLGYRLPTEAEWEYAARAGTTTAYPFVPGSGQTLDTIAWYEGNSRNSVTQELEVQPVATKQPNAWGLYDMFGNAIEVLHSLLTANYFGAVSVDPEESGAMTLSFWCTRGCSYRFPANDCRSAVRGGHPVTRVGTELHGARLVRTAP